MDRPKTYGLRSCTDYAVKLRNPNFTMQKSGLRILLVIESCDFISDERSHQKEKHEVTKHNNSLINDLRSHNLK